MPFLVVAIFIVAVLLFCRKLHSPEERKTQRAASRQIEHAPTPFKSPSIDNLVYELERKALAYAIYRELMHTSAPKETKTSLYEKFSYVNLPPSLESDSIFSKHPELMSDRIFLENLNTWIVQNGGTSQASFFSASETIGAMLVENKKGEAKRIVAESIARTTG